jgi:Rrf2 family transcriptional regulator, cysteine metabolism repressor
MRFTTKTEYGVVSMVYLARHADRGFLTIKEIALQEDYPVPYIEKILQALKRAKLVLSVQGHHGGYRLARKASDITLKNVIDALEGATFEVFCAPQTRADIVCTHFCLCGIKPVWRRTKELLDQFYGSVTLEMMTKDEIEVRKILTAA